jgi:hypothetical protein
MLIRFEGVKIGRMSAIQRREEDAEGIFYHRDTENTEGKRKSKKIRGRVTTRNTLGLAPPDHTIPYGTF